MGEGRGASGLFDSSRSLASLHRTGGTLQGVHLLGGSNLGLFKLCSVNNEYRAGQKNGVPRLRECCRQVEAEMVSKSSNKILQTFINFGQSLYVAFISPRAKRAPFHNQICFNTVITRNRSIIISSVISPLTHRDFAIDLLSDL